MGDAAKRLPPADVAELLRERSRALAHVAQLDAVIAEALEGGAATTSEARAPAPPQRLLTVERFAETVGISRASLYRLIAKGFPAPLIPNVGRRVDLEQGRAWLVAAGFRKAKQQAKEGRRDKGS